MGRKRSTAIALLISIIFIASSLLVYPELAGPGSNTGTDTGSMTSNVTGQYYGFSFPYVYDQPAVPSTVGVQGISGVQVPISELGPQGAVGPIGHIGPSSISSPTSLSGQISSVSIQVYYGTYSPLSRSYASNVQVGLQNISTGVVRNFTTNTMGFANYTVPEGWYFMTISAGTGSYIGFSQEIQIASNPFNIVRYLMPAGSSGPKSVGNGPAASGGSVNLHVYSTLGFNTPQATVGVYNSSNGNALLAQVVTSTYGYANFTNLNSAYSYSYQVNGYYQSQTGVYIGGSNSTGGFQVQSGGSKSISVGLTGRSYWTASVAGSSPPQGYVGSISVTAKTTFTGGSVHFSAPFSSSSFSLQFVNTTVYFNSSTYNVWPSMSFDNSTVIVQSPSEPFGVVGSASLSTYFNNSRVFFSAVLSNAQEVSLQGGIWLSGFGRNSVFVAPIITSAQVYSTLTGSFSNSEFYDFNMTANIGHNPGPLGTVNINHDKFVNATLSWNIVYIDNSILQGFSMPNVVTYMSVNNSYVNVTKWAWQPALTFGQTANYRNDYITAVGTGSNINFRNTYTNYSFCYIDFTPKSATAASYPSLDFAGTRLTFYNDYIIDYPSLSVRLGILQRETGSYQGFGMTISPQFLSMNYTQLYGMDAIGFFPPRYFGYNFSHVNFSNSWSDQEWNPFEWFSGVVLPAVSTGTFNNCTFYGMHYNSTIWWRQYNLSTDNPIGFWQDLNVPNPPNTMWGRIFINYTTVYNIGIGTTGSYAFGLSEGGIYSYLNNNLFLNRADGVFTPLGTSAWFNSSYQQYPIGSSIEHAAGNTYLHNNWFLNLNNKTVPIQSIIGSAGQGYNALISLSAGNHFYYYPNKLQSSLPVYTTPPKVPFDNNSKHWYLFPVNSGDRSTAPTSANYTFEIPIAWHGQLTTSPYQDQYVFNSSVIQSNIFGPSSNDLSYAWIIEPDVNTSTGMPVVNFQNGLVGGTMPNFIWNGTTYQLAVEHNMTYISAQSSSAPSVGLQFQVPVGLGILNVWMYNSTSGRNELLKSVAESGQMSTVSVAYNPAKMPLGAVFFTNSTADYNITFSESGLATGTQWSVTLGSTTSNATTGNITFEVGNGSYGFSVSPVSGYSGRPLSGNVTVSGSSQNVTIDWNTSSYAVLFTEIGLDGESWSVTLGNKTVSTNATSINFLVPNGTYSFTITAPSNYTLNSTAGKLIVNGTSKLMNVTFSPQNSNTTGNQPPGGQPPPPSNPPPSPGNPPTTSSPPSENTGSGYKLLVIQLLSIGLAPSLILALYMGIYIMRGETFAGMRKPRPGNGSKMVKRVKRYKKKLK